MKPAARALLVLVVLGALMGVTARGALAQDDVGTIVFPVPLAGADPEGHGVAVLRFDPEAGTLCHVIVVRGIGEPTEPAAGLGNAHIHGPLPSGGIVVDLETEFAQAGASDVFRASNCVDVDAQTMEAILANPELFYVNIHTTEFPGGAIEGRLG